MATGMWGADLEQMTSLSSTFTRNAGTAAEMLSQISSTLEGTAWTGPAADQFRSEWHATYAPALRGLHDRLVEHSTITSKRAEAIRIATS